MNSKTSILSALILLGSLVATAQEQIPLLKGKLNLSVKKGTMECDFKLVDMPEVADYAVVINAGMNMRYIRNIEDNYSFYYDRNYNDTISDEGFLYSIPDNTGKAKVIRKALQFSYVGKFPVIGDTLKSTNNLDWKGNIAFNGYSVRADGRQSAWYPVLYDIKKKKRYHQVRYDIEVNCSDCSEIYVNGNTPVQGTKAHFKSDIPAELLLYAGNYKAKNVNGTYFLNPDMTDAQINEFGTMTNNFKKYYESKLHIPYKYNITYIQTTPVSKRNAWLFVSYPTIVNIGWGDYGMKGFFSKKTGDWFKPYMAHELGHYYFGTYKDFNSELGDVLGECGGEYLSMQITREFFKDSMYNAKIDEKIKSLKDFKPVPFAGIKNANDYGNRELYVYYYAPLIYTAIEKEIGMDNMWKWMHALLDTKADFTNFAYVEQTLSTTLNNDKQYQQIKAKYFTSDSSLNNAIATITGK